MVLVEQGGVEVSLWLWLWAVELGMQFSRVLTGTCAASVWILVVPPPVSSQVLVLAVAHAGGIVWRICGGGQCAVACPLACSVPELMAQQ